MPPAACKPWGSMPVAAYHRRHHVGESTEDRFEEKLELGEAGDEHEDAEGGEGEEGAVEARAGQNETEGGEEEADGVQEVPCLEKRMLNALCQHLDHDVEGGDEHESRVKEGNHPSRGRRVGAQRRHAGGEAYGAYEVVDFGGDQHG